MSLEAKEVNNNVRTVSTKLQLAKQVVDEQKTSYQVAKDTKVPHRSVARYASKLRKGIVMRESCGRSSSLDKTSISALEEYVVNHPEVDLATLQSKIKEECINSYCRLHNTSRETILAENIQVPISKKTIGRYVDRLKPTLKFQSIKLLQVISISFQQAHTT